MLEAVLLAVLIFFPPWEYPLIAVIIIILFAPTMYAAMRGAPFVPTSRKTMNTMLELAAIKKGERVYDLGCGDGRFVFAAARKGAKATGYELSIPPFLWAKARSFFVQNAEVQYKNIWTQDYRDADVVFCYLLIATMGTFKKKVWSQLRPGTRVISHAFKMEGVEVAKKVGSVVLYVK